MNNNIDYSRKKDICIFLHIALSLVFCYEYTAAISLDYIAILPLALLGAFFTFFSSKRKTVPLELFVTSLFLFMMLGHRILIGAQKGFVISFLCIVFLFFYTGRGNVYNFFKLEIIISTILAISCIFEFFFFDIFSKAFFKLFSSSVAESLTRTYINTKNVAGLTPSTAFTAGVLVCGLFSVLVTLNKRSKTKNFFLLAIVIISLILTGKRAHVIFPSMVLLLYYIITSKGTRRIKRICSALVIAIVLVSAFMFLAPFFSNLNSISRTYDLLMNVFGGGNVEDSLSGRAILYKNAVDLWREHLVFGSGWGTYQELTGMKMAVHNIYLQLLCETGILGLAVFIISATNSLVCTRRRLAKASINNADSEIIALLKFSLFYQLFFLLYGISGNCLFDNSYFLIYVLAITLPYSRRIL